MPIQGNWKWYITIAAVRQWMTLTGRAGELEGDNPDFLASQNELGDLSLAAKLAVDASERQRNGASPLTRASDNATGRRSTVEKSRSRANECGRNAR